MQQQRAWTLEIPTGLGCGALSAMLRHLSRPQFPPSAGEGGVVAELPHRTGVGIKGPAPLQSSDWTWCRMHRVRGQGTPLHLPAPLLLGAEEPGSGGHGWRSMEPHCSAQHMRTGFPHHIPCDENK